jgi:hypothetical protein
MEQLRFVNKQVEVGTVLLLVVQQTVDKLLKGKEAEIEGNVGLLEVDGTELTTLLDCVAQLEKAAEVLPENGSGNAGERST